MVVTATDKATVGAMPENRRAGRARRTVIALLVLAGTIYFGFILLMAWR